MPRKVTVLTDSKFDDFINRHPLCVVDFWAEWCGPCLPMSRIVEEVASELDGKVEFAEMNFDENRTNAQRLGIMALPTNVIFRNGKVVDSIVGAGPKQEFLRRIYLQLNDQDRALQ